MARRRHGIHFCNDDVADLLSRHHGFFLGFPVFGSFGVKGSHPQVVTPSVARFPPRRPSRRLILALIGQFLIVAKLEDHDVRAPLRMVRVIRHIYREKEANGRLGIPGPAST